jgi:NADH-quinone oxidoreductase subunit K
MLNIPMEYGLLVASVLFVLGVAGVLIRRSLIFVLLSLEVILDSVGLAFIVAASAWGQPDGQIIFLFILAMAAAEISIGLAMVLNLFRLKRDINTDSASEMRG